MSPTPAIIPAPRERLSGLDLLRAAAILQVIIWHLPRSCFPFGWKPATWAGVDLFFVLSGYLIGTQLLRPYTHGGRPSFGDFFLRRLFRVMPAFLVVLTAYFLFSDFREQPGLAPLWRFLTFSLNFGLDAARTGAFSHAWSLCVEEHFYLILPLVVYALMRKPSTRLVVIFSAAVILLGEGLRALLWIHYIQPLGEDGMGLGHTFLEYIYYPTYCRLDGLLVGVVIAALRLFQPAAWARATAHGNLLLGSGLLVLIGAFALCQSMFSFATAVAGYPLLALGFGLLVMASLSPQTFLARRRVPGAASLATLSYSLYLTHKEVMHWDQSLLVRWPDAGPMAQVAVYFFSFLVTAAALHFCVEQVGFRLRDRVLPGRLREIPRFPVPAENSPAEVRGAA